MSGKNAIVLGYGKNFWEIAALNDIKREGASLYWELWRGAGGQSFALPLSARVKTQAWVFE